MNRAARDRMLPLPPGRVVLCGLVAALLLAADLSARDRGNPWATPEQRGPASGHPSQADGRFAPRDYDPVNDRRRRDPRSGDFPSGPTGHALYPSTETLVMPHARTGGLYDSPGIPWSSGLYGLPGLGYPSLYPYGGYPGSGMLWPGTGLLTPGLGSPLYGSSLGVPPLLGLPY
jgi:hypothetical protein